MTLPFPEILEIVHACACAEHRLGVTGRCKHCGGMVPWPEPERQDCDATWWPYTDEENER